MTALATAAPPAAPTWRIHRYPSALIDRLSLADGRRVTLRPVLPQDADAESQLLQRLSPRSRWLRFHGTVNRLPDGVLQAMTAVDYRQHLALVAEWTGPDGEPQLVADARYVVTADTPGVAEFAVAVADDWQGQGLGRQLLQRLARHAAAQGLQVLEGRVLLDNRPMLGLLRSLGATLHRASDDAGVVVAQVRVDRMGSSSPTAGR